MNTSNRLSKAYGTDAEVMAFEEVAFFVRDTARLSNDGTPIRALWIQRRFANRSDTSANPAELVDGVEDFRSEEHTSELQSLMRSSYDAFCLKKKNTQNPK